MLAAQPGQERRGNEAASGDSSPEAGNVHQGAHGKARATQGSPSICVQVVLLVVMAVAVVAVAVTKCTCYNRN